MPDQEQTPDRVILAQRYEKVRVRFFFFETFLSFTVTGVFALCGPAKALAGFLQPVLGDGLLATATFTTLCVVGYTLLFLPMDYAGGFLLENRFGLSTQRLGAWVKDQAKSLLMKVLVLDLFAAVLIMLLRVAGDTWWIWAGCFWLLFGIVLSHLFPILVLPLFYKIIPLADENLKGRLLALAAKVQAKIVGVYQFDMSRKTKKANALFTGLGRTKRIILGDTLLANFTADEIEVILAHEMGHYVHRHIAKQVVGSTAMTFFGLWIVGAMLRSSLNALGFGAPGEIAALPLVGLLLSVLAFVAMPISNAYSRYCERQADHFALAQTNNAAAFCASMEKLAQQNLSNKNPHPALEFFLYSHPSIAKRIRAAHVFGARVPQ